MINKNNNQAQSENNNSYDFHIYNTIVNLALNKKAVSSANESNILTPNYVTDGINGIILPRWSSISFSNGPQWIYIDLAQSTQFDIVRIYWSIPNALIYKIEISNDATNWTSVYRTTTAIGGIDTVKLSSKQNARYVRVFCEKANDGIANNVSISEIEIYNGQAPEIKKALPTSDQVKYQMDELTAFIHFGVNTFTDREWGTGSESPTIFNPTAINTDQWIQTLADAGFKKVIFTAKHHDGFCLWNSAYTSHDVGSSPWMAGKGDVVKLVSQSCAKYGVKFGIYLSPWDENSSYYGKGDAYNQYYVNQLTELLTNYGPISEVWMDGAKGSNVQQDYKFAEWFTLIKKLHPNCVIFSQSGPDIRWIGNESGYAGEPCWSTVKRSRMGVPESASYLNVGEENGDAWIVGESDVSIRPGWFYHANEDTAVKSLSKLMDIYFNSVGKNSVLLLNVPPDKRGLFHENDVNRLKEFSTAIKSTFATNLALNKSVTVDSILNNSSTFDGSKILDGNYDTYWSPKSGATTGTIEIDLGKDTLFDVISIQEYIPLGQNIAEFNVQIQQNSNWLQVFSGKTIGYKRLVRLSPTNAQKIRINITRSIGTPLINNIGIYKQPANISLPSQPQGTQILNNNNLGTGVNQFNFSNGWNAETLSTDQAYGGDDHWTTEVGATVSVSFIASKFYIVAVKDSGHGIMTISIDGGPEIDIDLYASERSFKQIVYESSLLSNSQHKIVLKCSGRKNANARGIAGFIDCILIEASTGLTFLNNSNLGNGVNQFNFSSGWNAETLNTDQAYGGDDHWTLQTGATVTTTFKGTKFYIVAVKDSGHGIMEVSIDNGAPIDVDLYNSTRIFKQIVFESGDLANSNHTVTIKCSGRKNANANGIAAFIDGIFVLDNNGVGLFEIEKPQYSLNENIGVATFKILRKGGSTGNIEVDYGTFAGTALDGINYQPWSGTLSFNNGEKEKVVNLTIKNTNSITTSKTFTLKLSRPLGGSVLGFISEANINLLPKSITIPVTPISVPATSTKPTTNLASKKQSVASSNESNTLAAIYVTDGKTTRWSSRSFSNGQQWIYIDLSQITEFNTIKINWYPAFATIYRIETSNDTMNWTSIYRTTIGSGKIETIKLPSKQNARYVRIFCEKNNLNPKNNVSIYEIEIYNI